jgi:hypothetical protein
VGEADLRGLPSHGIGDLPVFLTFEELDMTRMFSYFDDWQNQGLQCGCGWRGPLRADGMDHHQELMDFCCPECDTMLAIVSYPTDEEGLENLENLSEPDRKSVLRRQKFLAEAASLALERADQLPDIERDALELHWDFITEGEASYTVIRDGASIIWKELAFWEGFERFGEVAMLLKAKYGNRLRDLEPTQESYLYLLGDSLSAEEKIRQLRKTLGAGEQGPYENYDENGQLKRKGTYVAGEYHGPYESYYEDGQLEGKGTFNMGEPCGEWTDEAGETVTYPPCPPGLADGN